MKIALLVCDDSNKSFPHELGSYVDMFQVLFEEIKNEVELIPFDVRIGEYPKDLNLYAGFLTTGSACSVYDELKWISVLKVFIRKLYQDGRKYFGICFGHQMIAEALGGKVDKAYSGWMVGVKQTKIINQQSWMKPTESNCKAISSHQDQILDLPPNAERLGFYDGCANAMIKLGDHFVGFQGHPEFKKEYALPLMESRKDRIPEGVIGSARESFDLSPDHILLATWIFNFFNERKH